MATARPYGPSPLIDPPMYPPDVDEDARSARAYVPSPLSNPLVIAATTSEDEIHPALRPHRASSSSPHPHLFSLSSNPHRFSPSTFVAAAPLPSPTTTTTTTTTTTKHKAVNVDVDIFLDDAPELGPDDAIEAACDDADGDEYMSDGEHMWRRRRGRSSRRERSSQRERPSQRERSSQRDSASGGQAVTDVDHDRRGGDENSPYADLFDVDLYRSENAENETTASGVTTSGVTTGGTTTGGVTLGGMTTTTASRPPLQPPPSPRPRATETFEYERPPSRSGMRSRSPVRSAPGRSRRLVSPPPGPSRSLLSSSAWKRSSSGSGNSAASAEKFNKKSKDKGTGKEKERKRAFDSTQGNQSSGVEASTSTSASTSISIGSGRTTTGTDAGTNLTPAERLRALRKALYDGNTDRIRGTELYRLMVMVYNCPAGGGEFHEQLDPTIWAPRSMYDHRAPPRPRALGQPGRRTWTRERVRAGFECRAEQMTYVELRAVYARSERERLRLLGVTQTQTQTQQQQEDGGERSHDEIRIYEDRHGGEESSGAFSRRMLGRDWPALQRMSSNNFESLFDPADDTEAEHEEIPRPSTSRGLGLLGTENFIITDAERGEWISWFKEQDTHGSRRALAASLSGTETTTRDNGQRGAVGGRRQLWTIEEEAAEHGEDACAGASAESMGLDEHGAMDVETDWDKIRTSNFPRK